MVWINEMFASMEKEAELASVRRSKKKGAKQDQDGQIPAALQAWKALVLALTNDVDSFNNHPKRAGQRPVGIKDRSPSETNFQCAIYMPGMSSKTMILALENDNHLQVSVHPDFPKQKLAITLARDADTRRSFWMLGDMADKATEVSVDQLSEYLLKPILSLAEVSN